MGGHESPHSEQGRERESKGVRAEHDKSYRCLENSNICVLWESYNFCVVVVSTKNRQVLIIVPD